MMHRLRSTRTIAATAAGAAALFLASSSPSAPGAVLVEAKIFNGNKDGSMDDGAEKKKNRSPLVFTKSKPILDMV